MERNEIYRRVDHTLLAQTATWEEIRRICDDALEYGTASVCIPPSYVCLLYTSSPSTRANSILWS